MDGRQGGQAGRRTRAVRTRPPSVAPDANTVPGHPELKPEISRIVNQIRAQFPELTIESTYRAGGTSYHATGQACDLGTHPYDQGLQDRAGAWIAANLTGQLLEGIHNAASGPSLSVKNGKTVPTSTWGTDTWAAHRNHCHVAA
jgi:hypothetical protein